MDDGDDSPDETGEESETECVDRLEAALARIESARAERPGRPPDAGATPEVRDRLDQLIARLREALAASEPSPEP